MLPHDAPRTRLITDSERIDPAEAELLRHLKRYMGIQMEDLRICHRCKVEKQITCYPMVSNRSRRSAYCRECTRYMRKCQQGGTKFLGRDYANRNECVKFLGFRDYKKYLQSDLWKSIRRKVYAVKGSRCFLCGSAATELHHNRYAKNDLIGKKLKYINPICRTCHERIEFNESGKCTVMEAKKGFRKMRKRHLRSIHCP